MKFVPDKIYNLWRQYFGRYELDDPRPIAERAPYTYYLPPELQISALQEGDLVKLIFRSIPGGLKWGAENMWVKVTDQEGGIFKGRLDNDPYDMPQLTNGDVVEFFPYLVINIISENSDKSERNESSKKQHWDRCLVDDCVLNEGALVGYLYREEPDLGSENDKDPDSGWRIRGNIRNVSDEELAERNVSYVALGAVLNKDDSWLHLIDSPAGASFERDFDAGKYFPLDE